MASKIESMPLDSLIDKPLEILPIQANRNLHDPSPRSRLLGNIVSWSLPQKVVEFLKLEAWITLIAWNRQRIF
jgi:hypothetical protein